jgi:hypothetical protein
MPTARFHSERKAKEFLVSRIVEAANRENVSLSEVERKMLYFSETDWSLPDIMQVNEEFERDYDQDDYEKKIRDLVRNAAKHDRKESTDLYDSWLEAIALLQKGDHYILVMIQAADLRPRGDQLKLLIAGLGVVAAVLGYVFLSSFVSGKYGSAFGRYLPAGADRIFLYSIIGLCAFIVYRLGWITRW